MSALTTSVPLTLIVDPDPDTRKLHRLMVEPLTVEVDEAGDGAEALARALGRPPALVLTELRMPKLDGYALCGLLREEPSTCQTAIMVVTGSALPPQLDRALRAGADEVLTKPVDPVQVRDRAYELVLRRMREPYGAASARERAYSQIQRSHELFKEAEHVKRRMLSRTYAREATTAPPLQPPTLHCPQCSQVLGYDHSNVGGVSPKFPEQWDYYHCVQCGTFQYRHRTRRLRKL